jgi:hypothetical protein
MCSNRSANASRSDRKRQPERVKGNRNSNQQTGLSKFFRAILFISLTIMIRRMPHPFMALVMNFGVKVLCNNNHLCVFSDQFCHTNSPMNPSYFALANKQTNRTFKENLKDVSSYHFQMPLTPFPPPLVIIFFVYIMPYLLRTS